MRPTPENLTPVNLPAETSVWDELDAALEQLAHSARQQLPPGEFYRLLISQITTLLAANQAAVWIREAGGPLRIAAQTTDWAASIADRAAHERLIAAALISPEVVSLPPGQSLGNADNKSDTHILVAPVSLAGWTGSHGRATAAIEVMLPAGRAPSNYHGAEQLLAAVSDIAAEYHVQRELLRLSHQQGNHETLARFAEKVAGDPNLKQTAMAIANEGRLVANCDRLSVLTATKRNAKLLATSGVERVDRRSRAARSLEKLAAMALNLDEPIYYAEGVEAENRAELLPQVEEALSRYVDEFHARQLVVVPLPTNIAQKGHSTTRGVLVAEQFVSEQAGGERSELDRCTIADIARAATPAMENAVAWQELPLGAMLRTLGWLRLPRTLFRLAVAGALIAAMATALVAIPTSLTVDVRGQLLPTDRQDLFAPRSGIVDQLMARHGDRVALDQTLLVLRDPELAVEIERVRGEQIKTQRQLEAAKATRSTAGSGTRDPLELYRLSGEIEELKTQHANLNRQIEMLEEQTTALAIASPLAGTITTWQVNERLAVGRPVERGQVLLSVANTAGKWKLELAVPDERLDMLREVVDEPLRVEYRLGSDSSELHLATVTRIAERVDMVASPTGEPLRQVIVEAMPNETISNELRAAALRPGGSIRARIVVGDRPIGCVLMNNLWRTVRNWWEF